MNKHSLFFSDLVLKKHNKVYWDEEEIEFPTWYDVSLKWFSIVVGAGCSFFIYKIIQGIYF